MTQFKRLNDLSWTPRIFELYDPFDRKKRLPIRLMTFRDRLLKQSIPLIKLARRREKRSILRIQLNINEGTVFF